MTQRPSRLARVGIALLIALCLVASWQVLQIAAADIYRYQVRRDLGRWERAGVVPDISKWRRARAYNLKSLRLDPHNPVYLAQASRLWEWRLFVEGDRASAPGKALDRAVAYQRRALKVQPAQAEGWAHLAVLKARQLVLDAEFETATERSLVLGPLEPGVHVMLIDVGLMRWTLLADSSRSVVVQAFARKTSVEEQLEPWLMAISGEPVFITLCDSVDQSAMAALARQACQRAAGKPHGY